MNLRAMIPVNLRAPSDLDLEHLGNQFGLVILSLPVGIAEPLTRMSVLKERMDAIKRSPEALVAFGILGAIGATPVVMERLINRIFGMKLTAVMTNVPGPRADLPFRKSHQRHHVLGADARKSRAWSQHRQLCGRGDYWGRDGCRFDS